MSLSPRAADGNEQELRGEEKAAIRSRIFQHLAGIVIAPVLKALADRGVVTYLLEGGRPRSLDDIAAFSRANRGYLHVALRLLTGTGWLDQSRSGYVPTAEGRIALALAGRYGEAVAFIPRALFIDDFLFGGSGPSSVAQFDDIVGIARAGRSLVTAADPMQVKMHRQAAVYMEGLLVGPVMVALAREGVLERLLGSADAVPLAKLGGNAAALTRVFELLALLGWASLDDEHVQLTRDGRYAAQIASSYGVTVSYLPLFDRIGTLLFGNAAFPRSDDSGGEILVNRGMNVWGSGGAHSNYFRKVDEFLVELFNRPLGEQPRGICDMGCGDGTLLRHIYETVRDKTLRGRNLQEFPLIIVGADFNKVARRISKRNLNKAGVPHVEVIHGDINRPANLANELEKLDLDIHELLHVRSFLDHNRPFLPPANYLTGSRKARTTGAFASLGEEIAADVLEENLVRHLRRWAPYVGRFGLLVLELHTLAPALTAANLDRTLALAYDGTHGFSDQYLVELDVFQACAAEAGLASDPRFTARFPAGELATVSINFFSAGA
jgi:SAM-dependent methyltransferase